MAKFQTPGIHISEKPASTNSIQSVDLSSAAFVGYTQRNAAERPLFGNRPIAVNSYQAFVDLFGNGPTMLYKVIRDITVTDELAFTIGGITMVLRPSEKLKKRAMPSRYYLHDAVNMFFRNGGRQAIIMCVGTYGEEVSAKVLEEGLATLAKFEDGNYGLVCMPDATLLTEGSDCAQLQGKILAHCGGSEIAFGILDVHGELGLSHQPLQQRINCFRDNIGATGLGRGAAYFPFLNATLHSVEEVSHGNILNFHEFASWWPSDGFLQLLDDAIRQGKVRQIADADSQARTNSTNYQELLKHIARANNAIPPSGAVAGVIAKCDHERAIWKAPANVPIQAASSPTLELSAADLEQLALREISINPIRMMSPSPSPIIWGARTLLNTNERRYISVSRTLDMIKESIRLGSKNFIFEPNNAATWSRIKDMIEGYLIDLWKQGALQGAKPIEAFAVKVGLGETMTALDILEGEIEIEVLVALVRPAEFNVIRIQLRTKDS